jgi:PAS domain S-box-containing protein
MSESNPGTAEASAWPVSEVAGTAPVGSTGWLACAVVNAAPEAVVVTDPEGIVRLWNGGAEAMFGSPAAEAVGRSLGLIIPEKQRAAHWKGYHQTMETGYTKYGDRLLAVPALHRDGHRLSIEFSVALLRDETGASSGSPRSSARSANAAPPSEPCEPDWPNWSSGPIPLRRSPYR